MENYCQIGTPVQFFEWKEEESKSKQITSGWDKNPAVISSLSDAKTKVNIQVFPTNGGKPYIIENVRHFDFQNLGENFWNYIPQQQP